MLDVILMNLLNCPCHSIYRVYAELQAQMLSPSNYLFEPTCVSLEDKKVLLFVQESVNQVHFIVDKIMRVHGCD